MKRLVSLLLILVLCPFLAYAQEDARFEGTVTDTRPHDNPPGFFLQDTDQVPFVEIAPTTLESPGTRIYDTGRTVRLSLNDLQPGARVAITGAFDGPRFIAREVVVLEAVRRIWFDGTVSEIHRESANTGTIVLWNRNPERIDPRTHVYIDGEDQGTGAQVLIDLLHRTDEPVVVTVSNQNFFELNWLYGRVDVSVGTPQPFRSENNGVITFQLPSNPDEAIYMVDHEHALSQIPAVIPITEQTEFQDETRDNQRVSFEDLAPHTRIYVNMEVAGTHVIRTQITIADHPRDIRLSLEVSGRDPASRTYHLETGPGVPLAPNVRAFNRAGDFVSLYELQDQQWEVPSVVLITLDPVTQLGIEVHLVEYHEGLEPGPNQVLQGAHQGIHRGFWISNHDPEIGTQSFNSVLTENTVLRTPDGQSVSPSQLDWGAQVEAAGIFTRDEFILTEVIFQNMVRPFDITTRIRGVELEHRWMTFDGGSPIRVAHNAEVFDHFGDPITVQLLHDLMNQFDFQLRLTFGDNTNPDGSRSVSKIEAFRPHAEVPVGDNQRHLDGARITPWSDPPLLFPQSVDGANFNDALEVIDVLGSPIDARALEENLPVRVTGWILERTRHRGDVERIVRIDRIQILGGVATEYRGVLSTIDGNRLVFDDPEPFIVTRHTDLREETDFHTDFLTLAARIRSEGSLRLHLGADFETSGSPRIWWARVLRSGESDPSFLPSNEIIATFVSADEETRSLRTAPVPPIERTENTRIVGLDGNDLAFDTIVPGARLVVLAETRGDRLVATEIRVEAVPKAFEFTSVVNQVDPEDRLIHFHAPGFVTVHPDAEIVDIDGDIISFSELPSRLFGLDTPLLRLTQTPDSPTEAPVVERVEIVDPNRPIDVNENQILVVIDDPGARIGLSERRIEPVPLPSMVVTENATIHNGDGQAIDLADLTSGVRVHLQGQAIRDRLMITAIEVVGVQTFTGEAIIASVDVENRIITPAPEPPLTIARGAWIGNLSGQRISLSALSDLLARHPDFVLAVETDPINGDIVALRPADPRSRRRPRPEELFFPSEEVEIEPFDFRLVFRTEPPAWVDSDAPITGINGETLTMADLKPGQRIFVRGIEIENGFLITAIVVRPTLNAIQIDPRIADLDENGIENDVQINVMTPSGTTVDLPIRIQVDFNRPLLARSGHVLTNLPAGPHLIHVDLPDRPGLADRARVFISARGSAFRVVESLPATGSTGVSSPTDISITFNEPVHQVGDFVAANGLINPTPASGQPGRPELRDNNHTLVFHNVHLTEDTNYILTVFSAISGSGNTLAHPFRIRFSTGGALAQLSLLAGHVTLGDGQRFVGTVRLFNAESEQIAEVPLTEDGRFTLEDLFSGTYRLYVDISAEDGRTVSGFYDADGDGMPDDIFLSNGQINNNLLLTLSLPERPLEGQSTLNQGATVILDLDPREGTQNVMDVLPDSEVHVAVYAAESIDLIGYNVALTYDPEALVFQGVEENSETEANFLRQNGGLAVTLAPVVQPGSVELAGAILGPTTGQAVTGSGLLGIFRFRTKRDFEGRAEVRVPRIQLQSLIGAETLTPGVLAVFEPAATRILMRLSATPETIPADGQTRATIRAELVDAAGNPLTEETPVHFAILSGVGTIGQPEIITTTGVAETELSAVDAGSLVITVSALGVTEQITIGIDTLPGEGPVGPVALDLDTADGDQGRREGQAPQIGNTVTVDLVATGQASNLAGYQITLEFDSDQLGFTDFEATGLFQDAVDIPTLGTNNAMISVAFLGMGPTTSETGTLGRATFRVLDGFRGETQITLTQAVFSTPTDQRTLKIGTGGATVQIGGAAVTTGIRSDFDGDGTVGFADFISFAQVFGTSGEDANYESRFDLDGDGIIGFPDFLIFAQAFGQAAGKPARLSKPLVPGPGLNGRANLNLIPTPGKTPDEVEVIVRLTNAADVHGYSLRIHYDTSALALAGIQSESASRFASPGEVAIQTAQKSGELLLSDLLSNSIAGESDLVRLRFQTLDPTVIGRVEIADAFVSDSAGQINRLSGVHTANVRSLPEAFTLDQNFPNPFNPETVVPFALPESSDVHVAVYNVLGQEIRTLARGVREAGFHRVVWDGKDERGRSISSGMYFVRMHTQGFSQVRKMLLLK